MRKMNGRQRQKVSMLPLNDTWDRSCSETNWWTYKEVMELARLTSYQETLQPVTRTQVSKTLMADMCTERCWREIITYVSKAGQEIVRRSPIPPKTPDQRENHCRNTASHVESLWLTLFLDWLALSVGVVWGIRRCAAAVRADGAEVEAHEGKQ